MSRVVRECPRKRKFVLGANLSDFEGVVFFGGEAGEDPGGI